MFNGLLFHFGLKTVGLPRNKLASYFILIFNILRNQEYKRFPELIPDYIKIPSKNASQHFYIVSTKVGFILEKQDELG